MTAHLGSHYVTIIPSSQSGIRCMLLERPGDDPPIARSLAGNDDGLVRGEAGEHESGPAGGHHSGHLFEEGTECVETEIGAA